MTTEFVNAILAACAACALAFTALAAESTIDAAHPYAYGANIGWIRLGSGAPANGYSYANNSASDYGVNHDGTGGLRGYAYGANVGWLNFEDTGAPAVDLLSGNLSGYVWGANIGWISLSNMTAYVRTETLDDGPDSDGDDLPDAYEARYTNSLAVLDGKDGQDSDGDGVTDLHEWGADTDPLDTNSYFRIVWFNAATSNQVAWSSRPTRRYSVTAVGALTGTSTWQTVTAPAFPPAGSVTMTQTVAGASPPSTFYQATAEIPLSP